MKTTKRALDDDGGDEVDLARLTKDLDMARKRGVKQGVPPCASWSCWPSRSAPPS